MDKTQPSAQSKQLGGGGETRRVQATFVSFPCASYQGPTTSPQAHLQGSGSQSGSALRVPDRHHGGLRASSP